MVDCGDLFGPANGDVSLSSGTTFNSVATYSCSDGYNLVGGDMMRTCLASGSWSGAPSNCAGIISTTIGSYRHEVARVSPATPVVAVRLTLMNALIELTTV